MATPPSSIPEDPWDWNTDQVVTAFCDPTATFRVTNSARTLLDATSLEQILRRHFIDGCVLLRDIERPNLREDLGIPAFGHQSHIMQEIRRLRQISRQFFNHLEQFKRDGASTSFAGRASAFGPSQASTPRQPSFSLLNQPIPLDTRAQSALIPVEISNTPTPAPRAPIVQGEGQARLQTSILHSQEWLDQLPDDAEVVDAGSPAKSLENQPPNGQEETYVIDDNGRKRRRLVLNPLTPAALEDNQRPDPVETNFTEPHDPENRSREELSQPSSPNEILQTIVNPTLHSQSYTSPPVVTTLAKRRLELSLGERPGESYLGTKALLVDDVFYDHQDQEDQKEPPAKDAEEFAFFKSPASIGQRLYVLARMNYFLRQRASAFQKGDKTCRGVCPYPDSFGRKHQPLSITIYDPINGMFATRRDRSQWRPIGAVLPQPKHIVQASATDELVTLPNDDGRAWDYLNKWDDNHGSSVVLPAYGESGSENEYDSDTWREMEKENGVLPRPLGRSRKVQTISERESSDTIDQAVQQMVADWTQKRLPVLDRTAWAIWSRPRRNGSMKAAVFSLQSELQHLDTRLTKIRKEVAGQHWLSVARVRRQCESMRRTVYGIEEAKWTIGVLELERRPTKPRRLHKSKKSPSIFSEKTNETEPNEYETSSEESLGGFIVDDDEISNLSENRRPIRVGNDDVVMSESSSTDDDSNDSDDNNDDQKGSGRDDDCRTGSGRGRKLKEASVSGGMVDSKTNILAPLKQEMIAQLVRSKPDPANFVDLTLSDASDPETALIRSFSGRKKTRAQSTRSPEIELREEQHSREEKKGFKMPPGIERSQPVTIDLDQDDALESDTEDTTAYEPPELYDFREISEMDPKTLLTQVDRHRLLIYILAQKDLQQRKDAYTYVEIHEVERAQSGVWRVFPMLRRARDKMVGPRNKQHVDETVKNITAWYICWINVTIIKSHEGATEKQIKLAEADEGGFIPFYAFVKKVRCLIDFKPESVTTSQKSKTTSSQQRRIRIDYSDDETAATPSKKRKYIVPESQEAAVTRHKAHQRVADREKRQLRLKKTLQRMGKTEEDPSQVVVNMGKLDHQDLICLLPSIGERIQPHQKDGLRFLWREIIEDHASQQGCLLAQTMGLGKTMQVISFLVTVADAAKSSKASVREQIPPRLRRSQTIVLCPPTLVENWYDEFLIWAPHELADNIGEVRTVSSVMSPSDRLETIMDWDRDGGILVLPFSMLKILIGNGKAPLDERQHLMVKRVLLERPNIVIADEAHTFKNPSAQIARIMTQFASGSRIALTGSPLSNNLGEYYALIEWIAPGYLGEPKEFRSRYEEPITQGLYADSTPGDYRRGLKKLEVFKREVAPKIHRADLSVLQTSLMGKSEFVIKVAPTKLQEQLYQAFISSMTEQLQSSEGQNKQMKLLGCTAILRLICNHPQCYYNKLKSPPTKGRTPAQNAPREDVEANDDPDLSNVSALDAGISQNMIRLQLEPFKDLPVPIAQVSLANKMKVLMQILDLSINAGDKILVFTQSLPTLDYIERLLQKEGKEYVRMDGSVRPDKRQKLTKSFNQYKAKMVFIISTRAGGTGLNLFGANRVVIMDDDFNPIWEEQAVGRAYRIGQTKPVFVYRLTVGGTFEDVIHNQSLFKQQLTTRAVDHKSIARSANRNMKDYFQPLKAVEQKDLKQFQGTDPDVLDYILASQAAEPIIREIVACETFKQEIEEKLTEEEQKEVEVEQADSRLRRADPAAYQAAYNARLTAQSAPKNTNLSQPLGTQAASKTSEVDKPMRAEPRSGPDGDIKMANTAGVTPPPTVNPISQMPSPATRAVSDTAKLFGDLVPRSHGISNVDPRQVNGSPKSMPHNNAYPTNKSQDPMHPEMGASTNLRIASSVPPKQHQVKVEGGQRAESEPWPTQQSATPDTSPSKTWAKFKQLENLLTREAKRTTRQ
ncbi:MAG: hypothetical protein Q9168_004154 [Polycauliona sp. 1 TL-2023]